MQNKADTKSHPSSRLAGLDLARLFALFGMVLVNFSIVMGAEGGTDSSATLSGFMEGKAAGTFVVLAGLGLGLSAARYGHSSNTKTILKRAAFLMVLGLLNSVIFPADILHYYAIYFYLV